MTVEHTMRDVEQSPGQDDLDGKLIMMIHLMGNDGWELVSVLPTGHSADAGESYVVSSLRLFFKRSGPVSDYEEKIYERCGVKINLKSRHTALVVYCPAEWDGRHLLVRSFMEDHPSRYAIQTRLTAAGPTTCAVCPELYLHSVAEGALPERFRIDVSTDKNERGPGVTDIELYEKNLTELDWRDKVIEREEPRTYDPRFPTLGGG